MLFKTSDTALLGGLMCLGYRPDKLQKNENDGRVEFVFTRSMRLEKAITGINNGSIKFSAHELAIELHSVRSRIKMFSSKE